MSTSSTNRRSFLKAGALVVAPMAAIVPAAAMAADGSAGRLAQLESEREITELVRNFVRRFNGKGVADCGEFVARADAIRIDPSVRSITEDSASDPTLAIAPDGRTATLRRPAKVAILTDFDGQTTIEQMARFQGQASAQAHAARQLEAEFTRTNAGWTISSLALA